MHKVERWRRVEDAKSALNVILRAVFFPLLDDVGLFAGGTTNADQMDRRKALYLYIYSIWFLTYVWNGIKRLRVRNRKYSG